MNRSDFDPGQLARSSEGTLHNQLYRTLSGMIDSGAVKPGARMPTEAELVASYGISRTTARRALDDLRREGLVIRQPGRGTFVLAPRLNAAIPHLHSITEEIEQLGYTSGIVPVSVERLSATPLIADALRLEVGDPVLVVKRIRTADGRPVFVGSSTLNITDFPDLADEDFSMRGLYPVIERSTGLKIGKAIQWLSAVAAPSDIAESLQIKDAAPVLQLERIVYLEDSRPIESVFGFFHGRIYKHYSESYRRTSS